MMDTGVDVPEVLNLVFFKQIRSRIKFVQMLGRGTRLCENIYGNGKDKKGFLVFDYCGNFEYFDLHPEEKDGKETLTLSQRLFQVKLDMLYELQRIEYQEDDWFHAYYGQTKTELQNTVIQIKSHDNRIQVREAMRYVDKYNDKATWLALSPVMVKEAIKHLSPLLDSGLGGCHLAVAFDIRMYHIEKALLQSGTIGGASGHIKAVRMTAQYLLREKASIPLVLEKASGLKELTGDAFWDTPTVPEIEEKRKELRDLMQFLIGSGRKQSDIDIADTIDDAEYQPDDTMIDIRTTGKK